jgi:hypothetical protein
VSEKIPGQPPSKRWLCHSFLQKHRKQHLRQQTVKVSACFWVDLRMEKQNPKYFELVLLCQESEKRVFYRLYAEHTDLDRKLWRGGKSLGELEMMKHRTGILSALPENVTPIAGAMGRLIDHNIDAGIEGGVRRETENSHKVWIVKER